MKRKLKLKKGVKEFLKNVLIISLVFGVITLINDETKVSYDDFGNECHGTIVKVCTGVEMP